jgi:hypothetical protein
MNHGRLILESFTKAADAYIGFERAPSTKQIETIIRSCPAPIRGFSAWTDTVFSTESHGDVFDWSMLEHYGTKEEIAASQKSGWADFGQDSADRFAADVERWALATHAVVPIRFLIGPCASDGDAWDAWTCDQLADVMVPFLEDFAERNGARMPEEAADRVDADDGAGPLTRGHLACLLQNLDPGHAVRVSRQLAPRIAKLRKAFPI